MWKIGRRDLIAGAVAMSGTVSAHAATFKPNWSSLVAGWDTPEWFRDAKFGIWAHWGPQCQPEAGDWYGRLMYVPGSPAYKHHVANYGHPADTGFIDIIGKWKAQAWDPAALLRRYKQVGAKYFMAMYKRVVVDKVRVVGGALERPRVVHAYRSSHKAGEVAEEGRRGFS